MRNKKSWSLLALLLGACAIPDVDVVDWHDSAGGSSSSDEGGTSQGGTKGPAGKAGSTSPTTDGGAGSGGTGDTGPGGEPSVGGSIGTGGSRPSGGTGGSGVPPAGAVAKFCNEVTISGQAVDLELRIGSGASPVRIVARTGTCQPVVNTPCKAIPTGTAVPVKVYDVAGNNLWMASPAIVAGDAWIFTFFFDENTQMVGFAGKSDNTPAECSSTDFDDFFPGAT